MVLCVGWAGSIFFELQKVILGCPINIAVSGESEASVHNFGVKKFSAALIVQENEGASL